MKSYGSYLCQSLLILLATVPKSASAADNVTTWRYDIARTGQYLNETKLSPANVTAAQFGKLRSYPVDGYVYAQPLYMSGVNTSSGQRNVVFIATEHDSVYAFDAGSSQQLWKSSLIDTTHGAASGATTVPSADVSTADLVPEIGITGTPVIDPGTGTLFVVAKSKENGGYVQRLHALDVTTGNEKPNSPVVIQGSVAGTGKGSVGGVIAFQPLLQLQRPGLLLLNNHVYIAYGSHGDNGNYHGWVFAYDASTFQQTGVYNNSPNGERDGIWESGAGLAADTVTSGGRMFFAVGNGTTSVTPPYTNSQGFGDSVERLDLSGGGLQVTDEWTPFDHVTLTAQDKDQGSGGVLILPDQAGSHQHELVQIGKNGRLEVLDRDNLGGYNTTSDHVVQEISSQTGGLWSTPAYWNGNVYIWGANSHLKQYSLTNGLLSSTWIAQSPTATTSAFPGSSPVITSKGTTNGVLWAIRSSGANTGSRAVLYAFDATNVANQLYSSEDSGTRDIAGLAVKFTVPLVVNSQVYVGAQGEVDVYGLLGAQTQATPAPTFTPAPGSYGSSQSVQILDSLAGANIYYTTDGTTPTNASTRYTGPITVSSSTNFQAIATATGFTDSGVAIAGYTVSTAPTIDFSGGFASVNGLTLNGSATNLDDTRLQLTTGGKNQAGSAFSNTPVNIQSFSTDFSFQLSGTAPIGSGITFTIQNASPSALGPNGAGLGYGAQAPNGGGGIPTSIAIKLDTANSKGEGNDSTGLYVNGASPTIPAIDLTGTGLQLGSGDTIKAHMSYANGALSITLTDPINSATYTNTFNINIPQSIGSTTAFVGFTGSTGATVSSQKILTWTFSTSPTAQALRYEAEAQNPVTSGPAFQALSWSGFPDGVGTVLSSHANGDSVTFTINVPNAGSYDLHVTSKDIANRGIWQLMVDGVAFGSPQDEYNAKSVFTDYDMGTVSFGTSGSHTLKFVVTGKNAKATTHELCFDYFTLIPN